MNDPQDASNDTRVSHPIRYLNTDLNLFSAEELTGLTVGLEQRGMMVHHVGEDDGAWRAHLEMGNHFDTPQLTITAILEVIATLPEPLKAVWNGCTRRELNIGYDCGRHPWPFEQSLSSALLAQAAALGADLGITIYPEQPAEPTV